MSSVAIAYVKGFIQKRFIQKPNNKQVTFVLGKYRTEVANSMSDKQLTQATRC